MIYEIALLHIRDTHLARFGRAFADVAYLLRRAAGYQGHFLAQGIESPQQFTLIVRWRSIEDHAPGFETSDDHHRFMMGLQEHFSEEPTVYHIQAAGLSENEQAGQDGAVGTVRNSDALISFL